MKAIEFKHKQDENLLYYCHPILLMIIFDMASFVNIHGHKLVITSTLSDIKKDKAIGRKSSTHRTGRAVDLRTKNLPSNLIDVIVANYSDKYKNHAAINRDGDRRLIVNEGDHLHVQISAIYSQTEYTNVQSLLTNL